jgi:hypothetical protein
MTIVIIINVFVLYFLSKIWLCRVYHVRYNPHYSSIYKVTGDMNITGQMSLYYLFAGTSVTALQQILDMSTNFLKKF